ncbi:MAG: Hydrogenase maturation factor HypB [Phycisphaerae bacterium]|nr:Hydrogenase maturation factor HypB [Phycisphaerae bacterium]
MNIPVVRKVLEKNDSAAAENRAMFERRGITCINLLGGAGCGKTSLLEALLPRLKDRLRVAVLEGDLATTRDAERIAALRVPVVQLLTEGGCHLTAAHVQRAMSQVEIGQPELLLVENVGNPVCPANFDLGEHRRLVVLSSAEGDDKVSKYPLLFRGAHAVVLSKSDLLPYVNFDVGAVADDLRRINPSVEIHQTDIRHGRGIDAVAAWIEHVVSECRAQRGAAHPAPCAAAPPEGDAR